MSLLSWISVRVINWYRCSKSMHIRIIFVNPFEQLSGHNCLPEETCLKLGCHKNAYCIEIDFETADPGYDCECETGFVGDGKIACDDINECDAPSPCGTNGKCINTDGSFDCGCEKGYKQIQGQCVDIDECITGGHVCDINAHCYNVPGRPISKSNDMWS